MKENFQRISLTLQKVRSENVAIWTVRNGHIGQAVRSIFQSSCLPASTSIELNVRFVTVSYIPGVTNHIVAMWTDGAPRSPTVHGSKLTSHF